MSGLFDAQVARVADRPAAKRAEKIPFLVMCGTLDTRWPIAQEFAASLQESGYSVETEWPVTPHDSKGGKHQKKGSKSASVTRARS